MGNNTIKSYDLPAIEEAAKIIQKDPAKAWTIHSLALEVGLNTFKLKIGFRKCFKTTVHRYINDLRIIKAKELLSGTDCSIAQVASKTGFDTSYGFSRCFRSIEKCTPKEWRRRQDQADEHTQLDNEPLLVAG